MIILYFRGYENQILMEIHLMEQTKVMIANHEGDAVEVGLRSLNNMKSDQVYIVQCDDINTIFLWNGRKAKPRVKFIGSRLASEIRMTLGLVYRVKSEDEGYETKQFRNYLQKLDIDQVPASQDSSEDKNAPTTVSKRPVESVGFVGDDTSSEPKPQPRPQPATRSKPTTTPTTRKVKTQHNERVVQKKPLESATSPPVDPNAAKMFWPINKELLSAMFDVSYMQKEDQRKAKRLVDGRNHSKKSYTILTVTITAKEHPTTVTFYDAKSIEMTRSTKDLIPRMHFKIPKETTKSLPLVIQVKKEHSVYFTATNSCFISLIGIDF